MIYFATVRLFVIITLFLVCCSTKYEKEGDNSVSCDFQKDLWQSSKGLVHSDRRIGVCGFGGRRDRCYFTQLFQHSRWIQTDIQSMLDRTNRFNMHSTDLPVATRKMIGEMGSIFVLRSTRTRTKDTIQISDVVCAELPLSMEHRCLRYKHLVIENTSSLVVGYIKDYLEPFDLSYILNTHANSSVTDFSKGSVTLPIGSKFKVVFRSLYLQSEYALVLIRSISLTNGACETCGPNEFSCSRTREEYIPLNKVCDLKSDCLEGEDEIHCGGSNGTRSPCLDKETPSVKNTSMLSGDKMENEEDDSWMKSKGHLVRKEHDCFSDYSNQSHFCPVNCTCSGLSLNCSSTLNLPTYITSITLNSLVRETLNFSTRFSSLKKIQITSCKSCDLYLQNTVAVNEITIDNCEFQTVFIDDRNNYLRQLSIFDSGIGKMIFSPTFDHYFDLNVQNSTLSAIIHKIPMLWGNKVDLSQTRGFPNIIERFDNLVVNYSSCGLTVLPKAYLKVVTLDLRKNKLRNCQISYFTQILHLQRNLLEALNISVDTRHSVSRLQYLDVSYNRIEKIDRTDFNDFTNLLYLKLNSNHIVCIHKKAFSETDQLVHLDLSNNEIRFLMRSHFIRLTNLQYLNLQNNNINVKEDMFEGLLSIQYLLVDDFTLCCAQPRDKNKVQCLAPFSEVSSCDHLIYPLFFGVAIWYIALVAVFGNFFAILYRYIMMKRNSFSTFALYSINLGVSDFLMGIYAYIIAGANITFSGRYGFVDEWWRHSPICTLAGVLATLSSEASGLFVLVITIDRIRVIRSPFSTLKENGRIAKLIAGLVWTIALVLSVLPLLGNDYFRDYYSSSPICISLPLSVKRKPGWEYSMAVFVVTNFCIFIGVLIGQIIIFTNVVAARKNLQRHQSTGKEHDMALSKLLIAIAVTDLLFWLPVGSIGFQTLFGKDITPRIYSWMVGVYLPLNSALNPMIYTFSAVIRQVNLDSDGSQNRKNNKELVSTKMSMTSEVSRQGDFK